MQVDTAGVRDWRELISRKVGLIRSISPQVRAPNEPQPPYLSTATVSNFDFRNVAKQDRLAAGKGRTEAESQAAAVGEAVERYCAAHWDTHRTVVAKWEEVRKSAIAPSEFVLYSERQYAMPGWPHPRWTPEMEVTWVPGVELPQEREVALPASLIYLISPPPRVEEMFVPATSNGLAAGPDLPSAVYSGLCELMERDALLIAWMNRLPAIEIEVDHSGVYTPAIVRHYRKFGVELRAFRMPYDLPVSVVMAIGFDSHPEKPAAVVGMGCHSDPSVALDKAVFEMCQGRPSESRLFIDRPPAERLRKYDDVKELEDHAAYLTIRENLHEFEFLWSTGKKARTRDLPNPSADTAERNLAICVAALAERGHRFAYIDLTTSDLQAYPYRVVRTVATGLQPIHFGWGEERLGGDRLFDLPHELGFAAARRTEADLNPCPHPLA